jgi:transketolase
MAVLLAKYLRYDFDAPGHADERPPDLLEGARVDAPLRDVPRRRRDLRRGDAHLPAVRLDARGSPDAADPWVDVATGSLGQGLPIGWGWRSPASTSTGLPYRVWVLCGDSETAEGLDLGGVPARLRTTSSTT